MKPSHWALLAALLLSVFSSPLVAAEDSAARTDRKEPNILLIDVDDNGPWLPAGSAKPFSEGKYTSKEGGHRVSAMVRWPGRIPAGQVSDAPVSSMDFLSTMVATSGAALPTGRKHDAFDLMPLLSGSSDTSPRKELAYYNGLTLEAVRRGPWKLHLPRKSGNLVYWASNKGEYKNLSHFVLNDLSADLPEKRNLARTHPEKTKALRKLAAEMRVELGDWNKDGSDRPANAYPGNLNQPQRC